MEIKRMIPLFCLVAVFVWGGLKLKHGFTKLMATDVHSSEEMLNALPQSLSRNGFAQYLRAPVPLPENLQMMGVSKDCELYVKEMEGLDLINFGETNFKVTYQQLNEPNSACSLPDESVTVAEKSYLQNCFLGNPVKEDVINDGCVHSLYFIRSELTTMLYRNKKINEIESLPVLTEILYSEVLGALRTPGEPMNFNKLQALTDQMIDQKSLFHAAEKISFYLQVKRAASLGRGKTLKQQDEIWGDLKKEFERAKAAGALEGGLTEFNAFMETRGFDPTLTLAYANSILSANPSDAWGMFLSAYGHWLSDEHEEAFRDLRKAIELAPKNDDYQKVQALLLGSGAGDESFLPGLKLGVTLQDFDK
jgi:hypothetical protein